MLGKGKVSQSMIDAVNKVLAKEDKITKTPETNSPQKLDEAFPTVADAKKRMADAEKKKFDTKKISTGTVYTKKHDADKVKDDEKDEMKSESKKTFSAFQSRLIESLKSADSLEEALSKDAAASAWIHDFVHSDNPKFAGKSMKKRKEMALAAYYSKQRNEALDYSKTTTDTLAGRVKGGKPNEHSSFKVKLEDSEEHEDHDDEEEDKELVKKLVKKTALKTEEDDSCVTPSGAKKIAKKEVHGHEKKMHHEETEQIDEKRGSGESDPLQNRADYATANKPGQVYKKTYDGDKTGMTKAYAYDIRRAGPKGKLPEEVEELDELKKSTVNSYVQKKFAKMNANPSSSTIKTDAKGIQRAGLRMSGIKATQKEEVEIKEGRKPEKDDHEPHPIHGNIGLTKGDVRDTAYKEGARHAAGNKHGSNAKAWDTESKHYSAGFMAGRNDSDKWHKNMSKITRTEEVEQIDETVSRKHFQQVADLIKSHENAEKRKELAQHHASIFKTQNPRFDHAKFMKAAGVNEGTWAEEADCVTTPQAKKIAKKEVYGHEKKMHHEETKPAVVKTNKPIGTRVADIGPGGKEYNVKTDKEWDKQKKVKEGYELHEKNDSHTHAAHYENDKGEWTGMNLIAAKDDEDAIRQAHKKCKEGCRLSRVERHIAVKEEIDTDVRTKDMLKGRRPTKQKDDVGPGSDGKSTKVRYHPGPHPSNEEVELDERTLTTAETKKKEHMVMSMKPKLKDFKKRYGERAKEVLYATATKRAKGE